MDPETVAKDLDELSIRLAIGPELSLEERMFYSAALNVALDMLLDRRTGNRKLG